MQLAPTALPDIHVLRQRCQSLAMLDAIVCPEWNYRYYSYNAHWSEGEEMASMRNGQGDEWFILFGIFGAAIKGLDHETDLAASGTLIQDIKRSLPASFAPFVTEPAFSMEYASFCYWHGSSESEWQKVLTSNPELVETEDGSIWSLALLVADATAYKTYAAQYFEFDLPLEAITAVYTHAPLTQHIIRELNSAIDMTEAHEFAAEIGYPVG